MLSAEAPTSPIDGLRLAKSRFVMEPAGTHSIRHGAATDLTEATPAVVPHLPKPSRVNKIH